MTDMTQVVHRDIPAMRQALEEDGVVLVRGLVSQTDLPVLETAIAEALEKPSRMAANFGDTANPDKMFFSDFNNWRRNKHIEAIVKRPENIELIKGLTGSKTVRLFHDHVLVKGGEAKETPWHHDQPYYLVDGPKNVSVWITPDYVSEDNALAFIRGSHKLSQLYMPARFKAGELMSKEIGEFKELTDDEVRRISQRGIITYSMAPGDAIVFNYRSVHKALPNYSTRIRRTLSIRYLVDDSFMTWRCVNPTPPLHRMGLKFQEGDPLPETWFPTLG